MRGVVVGTGKRLDEVGRRLALLASLLRSRDLQESKARLEEAQRVAHAGYWVNQGAGATFHFTLPAEAEADA